MPVPLPAVPLPAPLLAPLRVSFLEKNMPCANEQKEKERKCSFGRSTRQRLKPLIISQPRRK
jgi:hypothetical protein